MDYTIYTNIASQKLINLECLISMIFNWKLISKLLPVLQDEPGFLRLITDEQSLAFTDISYNLDMSKGYTKMILNSIKSKRFNSIFKST